MPLASASCQQVMLKIFPCQLVRFENFTNFILKRSCFLELWSFTLEPSASTLVWWFCQQHLTLVVPCSDLGRFSQAENFPVLVSYGYGVWECILINLWSYTNTVLVMCGWLILRVFSTSTFELLELCIASCRWFSFTSETKHIQGLLHSPSSNAITPP